ncbi:MAG: globin family protein [Cyanobacteria bacterium P01_B01_bin.77]
MPLNTELLTTSFELLKARKIEFSDCFYRTLFTDYPQVKPLFAHVDMIEQPKKLFASLVVVVGNLTNPDALMPALKGLGTRHVDYGVLPSHYPMVGGALLKAMAEILKEDWTEEVLEAWTEAYTAITKIMLDGLDYPEKILDSIHIPSVSSEKR